MLETVSVRNPRTGEHDYTFAATSGDEIAAMAAGLRAAQAAWADTGVESRAETLRDFCKALDAERDSIVTALSTDTGRRAIARQELDGLIRGIERWCAQAPGIMVSNERDSAAFPHIALQPALDPYPLLGAITPWNFPLLLSFIDVTPALLAGCTAIIKPSEVTPRFVDPVSKSVAAVPALNEVLKFAPGDGRTGAELIRHIDVVAFTGSVATGRKVAAAAAENFIPAYLELGGKDPVVILEGSDIERASTAILRASVAATGQACQSLERIYVHSSQHDEFVATLAEKAAAVPLSYPDPNEGVVGPLIFSRQAEIIREHIEDAVAKGAMIHTGGDVSELDGGLFVRPTVISNVSHDMQVMREETFGPLMPVMAFATEEEAIALANDTDYGLSAAVFGASEEDAKRVANRLNAGGISVNDAGLTTMVFEAQKSAYRFSGMGPSRVGTSGLTRFLRNKALMINRGDVLPIQILAEGQ